MLAAVLLLLQAGAPVEPLLADLPAHVQLVSSVALPDAQRIDLGRRLGGDLERITNSVVRIHGSRIQVNVLAAREPAGAQAVHRALAGIKAPPALLRSGDTVVVEYVYGPGGDALARKASWELGLVPRPEALRYRVTAEIAAVDEANYMACNPLFNAFLRWGGDADTAGAARVQELAQGFTFGRTVALRRPPAGGALAFEPAPADTTDRGAVRFVTFDELPERLGVPFVKLQLDVPVDDTGFTPAAEPPGDALLAATARWPADDPALRALADEIVGAAATSDERAAALLAWLAPGRSMRYGGVTGSRWGTRRALEQRSGHCWDFADVFVTLARATGVPARQVAGWVYGSSGHVWAEYWSAERSGWQQVDPTGGEVLRVGIYHVPWFTTEDGEMPVVYLAMPSLELR